MTRKGASLLGCARERVCVCVCAFECVREHVCVCEHVLVGVRAHERVLMCVRESVCVIMEE